MKTDCPFPLEMVWSITPGALEQLQAAARNLTPESLRSMGPLEPALPMEMIDNVAIIHVEGVMTRRPTAFTRWFGGTATELVTRAVVEAANRESVKAILLTFDTPGGSASGLAEASDAIFSARSRKPVWGQVSGLCCSAGYALAAQCSKIFTGRMDIVGSVGSMLSLVDASKLFEREGLEVVTTTQSEIKKIGILGEPITKAHRRHLDDLVQNFTDDFIQSIMRGRGMSEAAVRGVADGRVFVADEARKLGLIDGIQSFSETLAALRDGRGKSQHPVSKGTTKMSTQPATLTELETMIPGQSAKFYLSQIRAGATVLDAQRAVIESQSRELAARSKKGPGIEPIDERRFGGGDSTFDDPVSQWREKIDEQLAKGKTRHQAAVIVNQRNPGLREAMIEQYNAEHGRPCAV